MSDPMKIDITARDNDTAAKVKLKICQKCGWYEHGIGQAEQCDSNLGQRASDLIAAVPEVRRAGKLGYGFGHVVFEIARHFNIRFRVGKRNFNLAEVFLLDDLQPNEAADLVKLLHSWNERRVQQRFNTKVVDRP